MNIQKRITACSLWVLLTTFCVGQETVDPSESRFKSPVVETPEKAGKADQFSRDAFVQIKTVRKPGPVMDAATIRAGLKSHDRALFIKAGWIRDPYITLGPDDYYYLTGTQPNTNDPREAEDPYNLGLGENSIVGGEVRVYRQRGFDSFYGILAGASSYLRPSGGRGLTMENTPLEPPKDPNYLRLIEPSSAILQENVPS
jgi:hypothetical protein